MFEGCATGRYVAHGAVIPAPPNSIIPALKTRRRGSKRRSSIREYVFTVYFFELDENARQNLVVLGNDSLTVKQEANAQ